MFYIPFRVSPLHTSIHAVLNIVSALLPTLLILVTADFINTAIAVYNKEADMSAIVKPVALLSVIVLYNVLIGIVSNILETYRINRFRYVVKQVTLDKRTSQQLWRMEDPDAMDLMLRAEVNADARVWSVYANLFKAVNLLVFLAGILTTLFTQVWWIALPIIVAGVPLAYIAVKSGREAYDKERELSSMERLTSYLTTVLTGREESEERSVFGYTDSLNQKYIEQFEQARTARLKVTRKHFVRDKIAGILMVIYAIVAMVTFISPVMDDKMSIGMFIALMGAVLSLASRFSSGLTQIVKDLVLNREYFKDLRDYMAVPEDEGATDKPDRSLGFSKIEFKDVRFKYPNTEKIVLNGVSFTIENGKHYSFVGENGSGKTTITKLLCRLYSSYEGEILIDGRSLRDIPLAQVKGLVSVVFQDFGRYEMSLFDNMQIADLDNTDIRKQAESALQQVGLTELMQKLKDGMDTPLGKAYENAVDISGGEWQRVALARSIMSPAPLRILDEPTASLDPISESRVYRNFEQVSRGKSAIFISHRLGSTKLADVIFVLDGGKITESGSHAELMARDGLYRKMFDTQAEWYKDEGGAVNE